MNNKKFFNAAQKGVYLTEKINTFEDFYNSFLSILPNPSKLLKEHGTKKVFSETASDATVRGAVNTIFEGIGSLEWEIMKLDSTDAEVDMAYQTMEKLMRNNIVKKIIYAIFYGYQPLNIVWQNLNGKYLIDKVIELPHDSIVFDGDRNVKVITSISNNGVEPEPYRFLMPVYDSTYQNPYGTGLFLNCYKHVFIKNNIFDFWTIYAEDYGSPGVMGSFTQAAASMFQMSPEDFVSYFYQQIESMRGRKIIVHPEGTNINSIPSGGTTSAEIFSSLIQHSKTEINALILGHESASSATPGKLGNEQMAKSAKTDRIESYTEFLTYHLNELLKWQHELNFNSNEPCQIRFYEKDDLEVYTKKALLVKELSAIGVKFNEDYFEDEFNIDKKYFTLENINQEPMPATIEVDKPQGTEDVEDNARFIPLSIVNQHQSNNFFAENKEDETDLIQEFSDFVLNHKDFKDVKDSTIETIVKELNNYDDYQDMLDHLYDIYDEIDIENKESIVKKLMLIIAIYGYNQQKEGD